MGRNYRRPRTPEAMKHAERMRQEKVTELHSRLAAAVAGIQSGEDWQRFLAAAGRFHHYSANNILLIAAQRPDATRVAGFKTWQSLGRQVRKGEKGIAILRPILGSADDDGGQQPATARPPSGEPATARRILGFGTTHVFDISQTDGDPLPEPPRPLLLQGQAPAGLWDALAAEAGARGFEVRRCPDAAAISGANGVTNYADRTVTVRSDVDDAQAVKTLAHELAHVMMHDPGAGGRPECRGLVEVEAESVAYIVAAEHGLDSADYSFAYVAGWAAQDPAAVERTAGRVIDTAASIIDAAAERIDPDTLPDLAARAEQGRTAGAALASAAQQTRAAVQSAGGHDEDLTPQAREALDLVQDHYQQALAGDRRALDLLAARGISAEAAAAAGAGVAAGGEDRLPGAVPVLAGIGAISPTGAGGWRKTLHDRLTFPLTDEQGRVRGWTGRDLTGRPGAPKWMNSPASVVFDKQSAAFRAGDPGGDSVIVTEGAFDALAAAAARPGAAAFAPAGTALSGEHARQLAAGWKTVIVALDSDPAGRDAAARLYDTLAGAGISNPRQAVLPDGTDPADLAAADPARLTAALTGTRPLIAAKIERIIDGRADNFIPTRVAAMRHAVAALTAHPDPAERAQLTEAARQRLDLGRDTVQAITTDTPAPGAARFPGTPDRTARITAGPMTGAPARAATRLS